jgi:hypothetical protein
MNNHFSIDARITLICAGDDLATLQEMATVMLRTIQLRGGTRRPWTELRLFLVTTVADTLHYGDDIVNAAAVRAFDPNRSQLLPLPLRLSDLLLLAVLAGCTRGIADKGNVRRAFAQAPPPAQPYPD